MILQTLRIVHASGAYLRRQAQALATLVGGAPGRGVRRQIIDGYLIQSRKVSDKAVTTTIQDLPGAVIGYNDPYFDGNGRKLEQYATVGPRDDFTPKQRLADPFTPLAPDPDADVKTPNFAALLTLGTFPGDGYAYHGGEPTECGKYLCRGNVMSSQYVKKSERGIPEAYDFCAQFTVRSSISPARAFAVRVSEDYLRGKTAGYGLAARNTNFMEFQVGLPTFPVCAFDGKSLFIALQGIIDGKQPDKGSMIDAGARALLIARLDITFEGELPVAIEWGWHHLFELTKSSYPSAMAYPWKPYNAYADGFWYEYGPNYFEQGGKTRLYGNMQNAIESVKLSLSSTGKLAVFAISRCLVPGWLPDWPGYTPQPEVFCAQTLLSFTLDTASATPAVVTRVVDLDCGVSNNSTPYKDLGLKDPDVFRNFNLVNVHHLGDKPRAIVYGHLMKRLSGDNPQAPTILSEWRTLKTTYSRSLTDDMAFIAVYDDTRQLTVATTPELGAALHFPISPGRIITYEMADTVRSVRLAAKVSETTLLLVTIAYPFTSFSLPALRMLQYTEGGGWASLGLLEPAEGEGGTALQLRFPSPSCYQQAQYNDKGQEITPAGVLFSYYGEDSSRSYLSKDGGTTFTEYIKFGCTHGVYYLGSPLWSPEYGNSFTKQ